MVISNGALYVHRDRKGRVNYDIIKKNDNIKQASSSETELGISLQEAKFKDVELIYIDDRAGQELKLQLQNAVASGEFSNKQFSLSSFAEIKSEFLDLPDGRFLVGKNLIYDAKINVDLEKGKYQFEDVNVGVESTIFKIDGTIETKGKNTFYDLVLKTTEGSIESMLDLLPAQYLDYFGDFKSKGTFLFSASIKGQKNDRQNPSIKARFGLKNGKISSKKLSNSLKDVTFTALFNNGKNQDDKSSSFSISDFKGYFNRELIASDLKISNFDDPLVDFSFDGTLPLASVYGLFNHPAVTAGDGEIEIKNLFVKGKYKDMLSNYRISRVKAGGIIELDDAELAINEENIVFDKGELELKDNSLLVKEIKVEGAGSEIMLNGKFLNLIPVLFADSLNTNRAELSFQASLDARELDIDRLINLTKVPVKEDEVEKVVYDSMMVAHTQKQEWFTNMLDGSFQAKIDAFNYKKIEGENFSGSLQFNNNELIVKGNTSAMEGRFNLDGKVFFEDKPYLKANLICDEIDVTEFFRQSEDFGQDFLQYKNVKGELEAKLAIRAYWNEEGVYQNEKLWVIGDVSIKNGELIGFKMLYDFSDYIKYKDLRHIKFTNMRNWLEVKNETVHLPAMFIQTNAMNMTVSGEHSFENDIDYNILVNAGQVFWSKFKKYNPNKKPQPAKKKGWFNLWYRIYGTTADYEMANDKRTVKRRFDRSERRKKEIQAALNLEFGGTVKVEPEKTIPEFPETETGTEEEEFLDFEVEGEEPEEEVEFMWEDDGD